MERADHARVVDRAFSAQAESYNVSVVANAEELLQVVVDRARPEPTERWLDAACGPGIVSRRLAARAGSVHGIDVTPAMVKTARREAQTAGLDNVTFDVGDATQTAEPDASFDGAVTRFSIHHIPLPSRLLDELRRVVRPRGSIVVLDHLADDDAEARSWCEEIERLRDPSHWACLSRTALRQLGHSAGLTLAHEQQFSFELDFDDWLRRGIDDPDARDLVELSLTRRPSGSDYFNVRTQPSIRTLRLQMWLGVWTST